MTTEIDAAADDPQSAPRAIPLSLVALAVFYGGMVTIAGVLGNKQVAL
ncbi:MAG: VUT family protein, partial [Sphingomonas sp.]